MALEDYGVKNDCFKLNEAAFGPKSLSFPCSACIGATCKPTEEPCRYCGHNANAADPVKDAFKLFLGLDEIEAADA